MFLLESFILKLGRYQVSRLRNQLALLCLDRIPAFTVSWLVAVLCCSMLRVVKMHNTCTNVRSDLHYVYGFCSGSCRLLLRHTCEVTHIAEHLKPYIEFWSRLISTSECKWWANNGVEKVTFRQQCSEAEAQAQAEFSGRLRHMYRDFCATMVCICFKVYNTFYREVSPTMYEFANGCKFYPTLCSRTRETASQTMC